jgi:hypothetical protein
VVSALVNRGEQVLAADLIFSGEMAPEPLGQHTLLVATIGDRPLGIEAGQLIALAQWLKRSGAPQVRIHTNGIRSQLQALVAAALEPSFFSELISDGGIRSLRYLLDTPVKYREASDLFCLDLYKTSDIDQLTALAAPTRVIQSHSAESK